METTLGGNRLGAGKKEKIYLRDYERSTHDLGYIFRTTMAAGTLVPFINEIALPGDSHEIRLDCDIMTHPTIGPLFGSFKVQLDVFTVPIRLYNAGLHMNMLNIGLKMNTVYLPQVKLEGKVLVPTDDLDNAQINTSCIMSYFDVRGVGNALDVGTLKIDRQVCALKWLMYWDIYKNYYANKQEGIGYVIHNDLNDIEWVVDEAKWKGTPAMDAQVINDILTDIPVNSYISEESTFNIKVSSGLQPIDTNRIRLYYGGSDGRYYNVGLEELFNNIVFDEVTNTIICTQCTPQSGSGGFTIIGGYEIKNGIEYNGTPQLVKFDLENIDNMRLNILQAPTNVPFMIVESTATQDNPYNLILKTRTDGLIFNTSLRSNQEGLGIKTYQSDINNNWLDTEWIDGADGINNISKIIVTDDAITVNEILLAKKVYDMLNRIAVSGGSYDDWLDATYTHERIKNVENPIYMGGLSKELVFQEVISNSATVNEPLGTLAGRGKLTSKHKGGYVKIKTDEPSYIIGLVSLTPRIDYSQGNKWDSFLKTMDDFHKPGLDGIGFQNLQMETLAYWTAVGEVDNDPLWFSASVGKQPAWINYMTNVNKVRGNFATATQQMYMTLNRKYEPEWNEDYNVTIKDLTTYIDPAKFNNIFADTRLDAQNFWTQIRVDMTARRKMSAKIIPNL